MGSPNTSVSLPRQGESRPEADAVRLQARLSLRGSIESGDHPVMAPARTWREPQSESVAPGIDASCSQPRPTSTASACWCGLRLARAIPRTLMGPEESHLLDGELWIDERRLYPGDHNYAALDRATTVSGARQTAAACLSPAPKTCCDNGARAGPTPRADSPLWLDVALSATTHAMNPWPTSFSSILKKCAPQQ
jgi:hypothetical protein